VWGQATAPINRRIDHLALELSDERIARSAADSLQLVELRKINRSLRGIRLQIGNPAQQR
jgi:hypothetical protein